jgi:hypothetical protein
MFIKVELEHFRIGKPLGWIGGIPYIDNGRQGQLFRVSGEVKDSGLTFHKKGYIR